jgi:prophage antirepressor-like protein
LSYDPHNVVLADFVDNDEFLPWVFESDDEDCKRFRRWMTHEVLPAVVPLNGRVPRTYVATKEQQNLIRVVRAKFATRRNIELD